MVVLLGGKQGSPRDVVQFAVMALYSLVLMAVLVIGAPYWLARMFLSSKSSQRYRAGLGQRLGQVPDALRDAVRGRQVIWVHAVSVGEVLAGTRLVAELEAALGEGWIIVVSTTTGTGQALARERFSMGSTAGSSERVFFYPLDFAWSVRAYLRALKPKMLVLMESELWPRMLVECGRAGVPMAVVNARVSDRSYARGLRVRAVWSHVLRRINLFLAQSDEDARRLVAMGARPDAVHAIGNLKYDVRAAGASRLPQLIFDAAMGRRVVVAGSTLGGLAKGETSEEEILIRVWERLPRSALDWSGGRKVPPLLVLAPRHPQRFQEVRTIAANVAAESSASRMLQGTQTAPGFDIITIDTIGDLAAVYRVADVAFVGGSLVRRGGHNPLEPAQFGVPVLMGPSFENFRDVVGKMIEADGIKIVQDEAGLEAALIELLTNREPAKATGERGRQVFEAQSGATGRAVEALIASVKQ